MKIYILFISIFLLMGCSSKPNEIIIDYEKGEYIYIYKEKSFQSIKNISNNLDKNLEYNINFNIKLMGKKEKEFVLLFEKNGINVKNKIPMIDNPHILKSKNESIFFDDPEAKQHPLFFHKN